MTPPVCKSIDDINDAIIEAAKFELDYTIEDNSFSYEYGNEKGVHDPGSSLLVEGDVRVELDVTECHSTNADYLEVDGEGKATKTMGENGEWDFEFEYKYRLIKAEELEIKGRGKRLIVTYLVEGT